MFGTDWNIFLIDGRFLKPPIFFFSCLQSKGGSRPGMLNLPSVIKMAGGEAQDSART